MLTADESSSKHEPTTALIKLITRFFHWWSFQVANHAILMILLCTVLTLIGTFKVITTPNENDITGYTPYGARARDEFEAMTDYFAHNGNGIAMFLLILPKKHDNVLDRNVLNEALRVEELVTTNFTLANSHGEEQNYRQFCTNFCQINDAFVQFARSYLAETSNGSSSLRSDRIELKYPVSSIYSRRMNIQPHFFGIDMMNDTDRSTSISHEDYITNMKSSKMIALLLRSERKDGWTTQKIKEFEMMISDYFDFKFKSDHVRVLTLSTSNVEAEVVRAGMSLLPFLIVGFVIMSIVSSLTTFLSALYMHQVSMHKFILAVAACICPFMACGTALGTLFYCGVRFGSVLCVTPFLVLAIGVDDAYLMIHSWQRITDERRAHPHPHDSPGSRLAAVLTDTGPAILISALTNIFADVAGCFTSSPELTLLAYGNMACIFCDFLYQITFYSAIMTITARFEMKSEQEKKNIQVVVCGDGNEKDHVYHKSEISLQNFDQIVKKKVTSFLDNYILIITNGAFQAIVIIIWIMYLMISIYGITIMNINLSPKKLFMADSSLVEMDELRVEYVVPHFYLAQVFVRNPGDFNDPQRVRNLDRFVNEMESIDGSWGAQSTNYFLRDFREFEKTMAEINEDEESDSSGDPVTREEGSVASIDNLPMFLAWPEYSFWKGFVHWHNSTNGHVVLDKFFLTFAVHGEKLKTWTARGDALREWRRVVDKYRDEFDLSVYSDDGIYVDLIENMPTDAWQSAVATLACMAFICFIFMFDITTVMIATSIIASVMTGILGSLSLTGTDLDPIVMAALIISIGFSVDIPAHISYHYHISSSKDSIKHRLHETLSSVGFPAIQASFSTSLCVLSLKFTSVYMSNVFVKTMIVCMVFCVWHALVLLPCLFSVAHRIIHSRRGNVQPSN